MNGKYSCLGKSKMRLRGSWIWNKFSYRSLIAESWVLRLTLGILVQ